MLRFSAIFLLSLWSGSVIAEEGGPKEGVSLIERGAEMLMQGFLDEIEPELNDLKEHAEAFGGIAEDMLAQMGPRLQELLDKVDDIANYEAPELLPNGDILIRRRPDAPTMSNPIDL